MLIFPGSMGTPLSGSGSIDGNHNDAFELVPTVEKIKERISDLEEISEENEEKFDGICIALTDLVSSCFYALSGLTGSDRSRPAFVQENL